MSYREAISQAIVDAMTADERVLIVGVGVTGPTHIFGTLSASFKAFPGRFVETPLSENAMTGMCVGLAIEGYRPILVHARADFLMVSMEALVNTAAKWSYINGRPLPMVIRAIIGRGWGQGIHHSQDFTQMLSLVPGLAVYQPVDLVTYREALNRGLNEMPTVIFEPRILYDKPDTPCPASPKLEAEWYEQFRGPF